MDDISSAAPVTPPPGSQMPEPPPTEAAAPSVAAPPSWAQAMPATPPPWAQAMPAKKPSYFQRAGGWWGGLSRRGKIVTGALVVVAILVLSALGSASKNAGTANSSGGPSGVNIAAGTTPTPTPVTIQATPTHAVIQATPTPVATPTPTPTPTPKPTPTPVPTPTPTPKPTPTPVPTPPPMNFVAPSSHEWALIVKSPDSYAGQPYQLAACIAQFDSATGADTFRAYASYQQQTYWALYGENVLFQGDPAMLEPYVKGDVVYVNAVVVGAQTYSTTLGGSTTVPLFRVVALWNAGSCT
jgi:hypothetical protein